ncbi:unnamed protein product [Adineta steineri]|uniref:NAD-dependent epimerase/dehydratase domain-containing protein n=1 Tax=Adineta steineri TaxID=433720 RepID=A0A820EZM1_9BILA|nr:unnamed protein product [Adineta steineri]
MDENSQSPCSTSKAVSDHLVRAYANTYNIPFVISYSSNSYGSDQYPEKSILLIINNISMNKSLPIYTNEKYMQDSVYVIDDANTIDIVLCLILL